MRLANRAMLFGLNPERVRQRSCATKQAHTSLSMEYGLTQFAIRPRLSCSGEQHDDFGQVERDDRNRY